MAAYITMFICATSLLVSTTTGAESQRQFDERLWRVGHDFANDEVHVVEYVLPGETVESWSELVSYTIMFDPQHRISLDAYLKAYLEGLASDDCQGFQSTIFRHNETKVSLAWSHAGCSKFPPQYEVMQFSKCHPGLCRWAYTTTHVPLSASKQNEWRQRIEQLPQD